MTVLRCFLAREEYMLQKSLRTMENSGICVYVAFGRERLFKIFYALGCDALVGPEVEEKFQGACPCWLGAG